MIRSHRLVGFDLLLRLGQLRIGHETVGFQRTTLTGDVIRNEERYEFFQARNGPHVLHLDVDEQRRDTLYFPEATVSRDGVTPLKSATRSLSRLFS